MSSYLFANSFDRHIFSSTLATSLGTMLVRLNKIVMPTACLLLLTACKLHPVYSIRTNAVQNDLCAIDIESIQSINGAQMYDYLLNLIPKPCTKKYRLTVKLNYTNSSSVIQKNSDALRHNVNQVVKYKLTQINESITLISGSFNNSSSYSDTTSAYINYNANQNAESAMAKHAAEKIITMLILFFKNHTE